MPTLPTFVLDLAQNLIGAVMVTGPHMEILNVNADWEQLYGSPAARVLGLSLYELDPRTRQYSGAFAKCLDGETLAAGPYALKGADGSRQLVRTVTLPWRDSSDKVQGLILITQDMLASHGQDYDHRSEQRLKKAAELADIFLWELDLETGDNWAAGAEDIFFEGSVGVKEVRDDLLGTVHPEDRARVEALWEQSTAEGRPHRAEYRLNRPDKHVWVSASTVVLAGSPQSPERLFGVMQNITARKEAEIAAEDASRAKGDFLATMSHEIRTPLNGILGMAQAMAAEELAPSQRERLAIISESGDALLAILNDILDLSKIEAGGLQLELIEFDLASVVSGAYSAFTGLANSKRLSFALDLEDARGRYVGDPTRLRQILYNLVSNALKFTHEGEIRVTARRGDGDLTFVIADTGIGIPEDKLSSLFQNFAQLDASTTREYGGTGLGLAICRQLAELMGGRIEVASQVGQGSTFTAILPLRQVGNEHGPVAPPSPEAPAISLAGVRVLAAEDNAVNRLVLKTLLHQIGLDPKIVEDGVAVVEAWEEDEWDLILMDVQMPRMDGVTATRRIRQLEQERGRAATRIVALTANAMAHHLAEYAECGMDGHVSKPILASQLFAVIEDVLTADESPLGEIAAN